MPAPMTRRMMTAMMMNLRPDFCSGISSSSRLFASACLSGFCLIWAVWVSWCSICSGKLLSSEIIFVVCLGGAYGTGKRELGYVVLIERADVLVVGLLNLRLRLRDREIVRHTGVEAILGVAEGLV